MRKPSIVILAALALITSAQAEGFKNLDPILNSTTERTYDQAYIDYAVWLFKQCRERMFEREKPSEIETTEEQKRISKISPDYVNFVHGFCKNVTNDLMKKY